MPPATLHRLRTQPERLQTAQAEQLRQMVMAFPDLPARAVGELIATIDRQTAAQNGWSFVMISPAQNRAVVRWLTQNSARPMVAVSLWSELFMHLRRDTGEVMQSREELAAAVGTQARDVSRIMSELEGIGAISRRREKVAGMRGPGVIRYFMSPSVGTHLAGAARDQAQADAPLLRLITTDGAP